MKREQTVEILHEETNFVVIKIPTRSYPGVLVQGDSLGGLMVLAKESIDLFDVDKEEALACLTGLYDELKWRFEAYQKVCRENQIT